jgi:hypothetical protein
MPSQLHEGLVNLFRDQPALAPELLAQALQADIPEYKEARIDSADLTELQPTEYRADLVVQLRHEGSVLGIVVEVQLSRDDDKGFVWPVYITTLRNRIRCPVCLLVVAPDPNVAKWASRPILLGGDSRVVPCVLHAANIPEILSLEQARAHPELAVLSALAHGQDADADKAAAIAVAAESAANELDTGRSSLYFDLIRCCLSEAARLRLNKMDPKKYEYQSDFARRYFGQGKEEGLAEGRGQGQIEGRVEGKAEGRVEGKAEGRVEGRAELAIGVLSDRFGSLPEALQKRIRNASAEEVRALFGRLFDAHTLNEALGVLSAVS